MTDQIRDVLRLVMSLSVIVRGFSFFSSEIAVPLTESKQQLQISSGRSVKNLSKMQTIYFEVGTTGNGNDVTPNVHYPSFRNSFCIKFCRAGQMLYSFFLTRLLTDSGGSVLCKARKFIS